METDRPILFYDGDCGLCAKSVQWCLDHDHGGRLRYAPLQGATYAALAIANKPAGLESMVMFDGGVLYLRSDAILGALRHVGGVWKIAAAVGRVVPRFLRDALYRFIARNRLAWFGTSASCRLPSSAESARFLA